MTPRQLPCTRDLDDDTFCLSGFLLIILSSNSQGENTFPQNATTIPNPRNPRPIRQHPNPNRRGTTRLPHHHHHPRYPRVPNLLLLLRHPNPTPDPQTHPRHPRHSTRPCPPQSPDNRLQTGKMERLSCVDRGG